MTRNGTLNICLLGVALFGILLPALNAYELDMRQEFSREELGLEGHAQFKTLLDFFSQQVIHGQKYTTESDYLLEDARSHLGLLGFSYSNCDSPANEQVVPSQVTLTPDPIKLPGNVTASGSVTIKKAVASPVKVDLKVEKKVFGVWVEIPCVDNVGSCTYDDVCSMIHVDKCPEPLVKAGLGCKCPFPAGNFTVPPTNIYINAKIPISGGVKVKAVASQGNQLLTCAEIEISLK